MIITLVDLPCLAFRAFLQPTPITCIIFFGEKIEQKYNSARLRAARYLVPYFTPIVLRAS